MGHAKCGEKESEYFWDEMFENFGARVPNG